MIWLIDRVAHHSDFVILATGALVFGVMSFLLAWSTRRILELTGNADTKDSLVNVVHGSLLAFIVFVLAHVLSDVRSNQGRAQDLTLREASTIARLNRDFQAVGSESGAEGQRKLREYVDAAIKKDWPALGQDDPSLAPEADIVLDQLVEMTQRIAAAAPTYAASLRTAVQELEAIRQRRLETATQTVPPVFWWVITVFLVGAMVMNGRFPSSIGGYALIAFHMGAIGMVIALVIVLDEPYRGESAVLPSPIAHALKTH
jgi:hypothetical protein